MKKLRKLLTNKNVVKHLNAKKIFGFAAVSAGLTAFASQAQAQIVQDNFTQGASYSNFYGGTHLTNTTFPGAGLSPSGTNLPGGTWQLEDQGYDGLYEASNATEPVGSYQDFALIDNRAAAAISLMSSGGYTEPTSLTYSATVAPLVAYTGLTSSTIDLGFYNTTSSSNYAGPGPSALVGVSLSSAGNLDWIIAGAEVSTSINPGSGIFDSSGFTTISFNLSFDASTDEATLSNVVLDGTSYSASYTTEPLSPDTIDYAGFTDTLSSKSAVSSFEISAVAVAAPEPSTYALLAGGALALGAYQYRRRQAGS